ncbi:unnamed protein product, partial [Polarella glacialis]
VNFKNVTLQVNFGSTTVPLPFKCHSVQQVPAADGVASPEQPKGVKFEVVFPVGVPDEGTFDWLDNFHEQKKGYAEISDRALAEWAEKSGMYRSKSTSWKNSNDKPDMSFGLPLMDDMSARKVLNAVVGTQPRNYVVMEVKGNLISEERKELMKRFQNPMFKTVAEVVIGEPPADFKAKQQKVLLAEKQLVADQEWMKRKADKEREKQARLRQKELEK